MLTSGVGLTLLTGVKVRQPPASQVRALLLHDIAACASSPACSCAWPAQESGAAESSLVYDGGLDSDLRCDSDLVGCCSGAAACQQVRPGQVRSA